MTRVGFVLSIDDKGWTGGANYFRNLLRAIDALPDRGIRPVILTASDATQGLMKDLSSVEVIHSPSFDGESSRWKLGKAAQRLVGRDPLLDGLLRRHGIDVLSHSGHLGPRSSIPTIAWIPDFQHVRLPALFDDAERATRDARFRRLCSWATTVLLSSRDAQSDLAAFAPESLSKSQVLPFVCAVDVDHQPSLDADALRREYGFDGPYFHLPNQFWVHKNHRVVIEALAVLKAAGRRVQVMSTGSTNEKVQPGHFAELRALIARHGLEAQFRVLGLVPQPHLFGLMRHCVAVINPSLFEGWSTTVEESKSLGKQVILSDIAVHREQEPQRATFFDPHDAAALAAAMVRALDGHSPAHEAECAESARWQLPARMADFAQRYQAVVTTTLARPR